MYFQNYRLRKPWVDKCIKSLIFEGNSKSNMVNGPKHLLINVKAIKSEKVSLSSMQNLGTVCEDIECLPQVFSS